VTIGKLRRVPLRDLWKHEATGFTAWLEENVDVLSEVLDLEITSVEREKPAGDFSVDLVGEDEHGGVIVIENQLEQSDHKHLGQLLTYLAQLEAKAAVWIVAKARAEHISVVSWLNEATSTPFFLVQMEAVQIGKSEPAPLLTLIAGPSEEARAAGEVKKDVAERYGVRQRFWTQLLEHSKQKSKLHSRISPGRENWLGASAGTRGLHFNFTVRRHETQVELYIDTEDEVENTAIFDKLHGQREEIERSFGGPLDWQPLEQKRACRIRHRITKGGWKDEAAWPAVIEATVDAMVRLERSLHGPIQQLKVS
jgi:hypothetical protein